jgi:ABC-type lipoprotein release transport system permease subunit
MQAGPKTGVSHAKDATARVERLSNQRLEPGAKIVGWRSGNQEWAQVLDRFLDGGRGEPSEG